MIIMIHVKIHNVDCRPGQEVGVLGHTRGKAQNIRDIFDFDYDDRETIDQDDLDMVDKVERGHQEDGRPRMYPMFSLWPTLY